MSANKIKFNWMTAQNIFSIGDEINFNFDIHNGINHVYGYNLDIPNDEHDPDDILGESESKNGCGKSTIFIDALMFGLFGKSGKDVKKGSIVNWKRKKNGLVKIGLNKGEDEYMMVNGVSPRIVELYKNGKSITKSTKDETLKYFIEEVLCTTYDIFKNTVILSVNDTKPIYAMNKSELREFTNSVFDLSVYGKMLSKVRKDKNSLNSEILTSKTEYKTNHDLIEDMITKDANFETDKNAKLAKVDELIANEESKKIKANIPEGALQSLKDQKQVILVSQSEIANSNTKISSGKTMINSKIQSHNSNIKTHTKYLEDNKSVMECLCNDCNVKVQEYIPYDKVKSYIADDESSIAELTTKLETLGKMEVDNNSKINDLTKQITDLDGKITKLDEVIRLNEVYDSNIKAYKEKRSVIAETTSSFTSMIEDYKAKQVKIEELLAEKNERMKYLKYIDKMLDEGGIKAWIANKMVDTLNTRLRVHLQKMGAEYTIVFDSNFNYKLHTPNGETEYANFSAGERMRINHATLFAFKDLLSFQGNLHSSILICDEILDVSIDSKATNAMMNMLIDYAKEQTVFLISHKDSISNYNNFDNVIEIKKENGFTSIVSDGQGEFGE